MIIICRDCISDNVVQEEFVPYDFEHECEICKRSSPRCYRALETKEYREKMSREQKHPRVGIEIVMLGREKFEVDCSEILAIVKELENAIEDLGNKTEKATTVFNRSIEIDDATFQSRVMQALKNL